MLFEAFADSPAVIDRMIVKATSMALAGYVFSDETDQAKVVLQQAHDEVTLTPSGNPCAPVGPSWAPHCVVAQGNHSAELCA